MEVNRVNFTPPPAPAPAPAETAPAPAVAPVPTEPITPVVETEAPTVERSGTVLLQRAVTELNKTLSTHARHMSINTHEATGRTTIKVYDTETQEVIREIPPESVLDAHANLLEMAGLFVDTKG